MNSFVEKYSQIWGNNPQQLMHEYEYQPELTKKLDSLNPNEFDRETLYEIVLWKLNRFPKVDNSLIEKLRSLSALKPTQHREAEGLLKELLSCHGIRLPMASTILRFINPKVFQIIDDRVFRVLELNGRIPTKPQKITNRYLQRCCDIYFDYVDKLQKICNDKLPFEEADRILYLLDIKLGNKIGD